MYDYVIVGAGSAGCVLAHRLSEDPGVRVLLLEAGGRDAAREIHIPAAFSKLFKTEVDWDFATAPQAHLHGRRLYWPRGKVLGGSSSINAMIYIRGHRADYDHWAALGNPGWSYDDVLPYFVKAEHNERGASAYHGVGGPLNVADLRQANPLSRAFVEAAAQAGIPRNPDFNGARQEGAGLCQVTQKRGRRWSTARAYLRPALRRPNLSVVTGAHVLRVAMEGRRAAGVVYERGGRQERVLAGREVILCGGAIGSPHLLLRSGVGPAAHLRAHGIDVAHDLPGVGRNLQDHLAYGVRYAVTAPITLLNAESPANLVRYLLFGRGMLTSNVAEALAFVRTRAALPAPDLQFHFAPVYYVDHGLAPPPFHGMSLGVTLLQPRSAGYVGLGAAGPLAQPEIQPQFLSDEEDLRVMVEGVRLARRIFQAPAFDAYRGAELTPGAHAQRDDDLYEDIRENAEHLYHPVGTCKMGADALAVVDAQLRVHGVEGLRVVDASVMPTVVRGNTNAPTIMIAEKAADMIRQRTSHAPARAAVAADG